MPTETIQRPDATLLPKTNSTLIPSMSAATTVRFGAARSITTLVRKPLGVLRRLRNRIRWEVEPPAVFHITHHKAGSQWILRILLDLAYERYVPPEVESAQFLYKPLMPTGVYPTVYVTREQFESVTLPRRWKRFVVIRDIRDTLISLYFSIRYSHPMLHDRLKEARAFYSGLNLEEGLIYMARNQLGSVAQIQWSWYAAGEKLIKYEDLLTRDVEILEEVLLKQCRLGVSRERLREVVLANRFEAKAGRKRGQEDVTSHERKGIAGDWKNYFTDAVAKEIKSRYGSLLIATGYEKNDRW